MQFDKLFYIFYDDDNRLGDILSEIANGQDQHESQKILDDHIETLQNNDNELMQRIDGPLELFALPTWRLALWPVFFGQAIDITDAEALEELHFLKGELEAKGAIRYWPRDKKAPGHRGDEDSGARRC